MPPSAPATSLLLICGDDEFSVKRVAREHFQKWCAEAGGMDHEIIDASIANSGEALKSISRLREALQTLPFFGGSKVVWFQNCNFLGDERAAGAAAVTETLAELAQELKRFSWDNVRLLISAGKIDKRKIFYKTLEKIGAVETFNGWSLDDRDWEAQAEAWARAELRTLNKDITEEALARLVTNVGPYPRLLSSEAQKLALYAGDAREIGVEQVDAIVTRSKHAKAFALGDALGERDLPRVLRTLDEELWEMKFNSQKSEIGLLYGLITKVRALLFLKEMLREGWLKPEADYSRFKAQLTRVPAAALPEDKRFNPLAMNPYVLFKALPQARRYSTAELVRAMAALLQCNQRLVGSGLDEALVLQQTLVQIVGTLPAKSTLPTGRLSAA
ncbi:MAG: DNA polymerase III subunit delta [Verrucomicrobia bacterium]|nr:DNA polymerase III subunit delta [Verrucomicrobiota bacterium]